MTAVTFDPANKDATITLSNGNLTAAAGGGGSTNVYTTSGFISGQKLYAEFHVDAAGGGGFGIGLALTGGNTSTAIGEDASFSYCYTSSGLFRFNGSSVQGGVGTLTTGDVVSVLFDGTGNNLIFWKNGAQVGSTITGISATGFMTAAKLTNAGVILTANFGATTFTYSPPAGYTGWQLPPPTPGNGAMVLQPLTMSGARIAAGAMVLQPLTIVGGDNGRGNMVLQPLTISGSGGVKLGEIVLEALVIAATGRSANYGVVALQPLAIAATGHDETVITAALTAPAPSLIATVIAGEAWTAGLLAPAPLLSAVMGSPTIITAALVAPAPQLAATGLAGNVMTAALTAAAPIMAAAGYPSFILTAALTAPPPRLTGVMGAVILANYNTLVLNTRKGALTEYGPEWNFNSYATFNGVVLGCTPSGVVVLGLQDLDNAAQIDGRVRTGAESFQSSYLKRVPRLYTSYSSPGDMIFRTITAENGTRAYSLPFNGSSDLQQRRIPVGKGPKSRFWQFEWENVAGADFSINDLLVYPIVLRRRVQ